MRAQGNLFEERAAALVKRQGMELLQRNFRCKTGEIDIIAIDNGHLVFIEVRARSNPRYSSASASVDRKKQQRLLRSAATFLQHHPQLADSPCRFDVIAFQPPQSPTESEPLWIRAAFTA